MFVQKRDPDNSLALINLGNLYQKRGEFDRAETYYKKVIAAEPDYYLAYTNLGSMYTGLGRLQEAVDQLQTALVKNPADPLSKFLLGSIHRRLGESEKAISYLEKILKDQPNNADVLFEMALTHDQREDFKTSIEFLKRAKAEKPENPLINNALGYAYAKLGENLDEAETLILKAIRSNPVEISEKINFRDSLSWVYYQKGDYEKAHDEIRTALGLIPDSNEKFNSLISEMNYHLGMISWKLRHHDEAKGAFRRSIQADPENLYAKKSEQAISELER
jgi:tetratricopeptide (TPR) repeat protein